MTTDIENAEVLALAKQLKGMGAERAATLFDRAFKKAFPRHALMVQLIIDDRPRKKATVKR